jgi:hypothetical protein
MTLAPESDGTIRLPLPQELRGGNVKVEAILEPVNQLPAAPSTNLKGFGALKGEIWLAPDFDEPLDDFAEYMQ